MLTFFYVVGGFMIHSHVTQTGLHVTCFFPLEDMFSTFQRFWKVFQGLISCDFTNLGTKEEHVVG